MNNQSNNLPGGLPLFVSGWGAGNINFSEGSAFWDDVMRVTSESQLDDHVDGAMSGQSSPRVWLFLHEPGESHLSVAAALGFARELAHRDQAVLLLDGDDDKADLTTWAGRAEVDGWIDLVRYGSSVLTCGVPMPFDGRRGYLLGVGSFTPADVTGLEVKDLLARLKRQADDILVVAPADAVGRLWAVEADVRLLCWDRAERATSLVESLLENFTAAGIPMTGMVGFGLPLAVEEEVPDALPADENLGDTLEDDSVEAAAAILDELEDQDEDLVHQEEEFARRKGNSSVFWIAALVSLALIGSASVYFLKFLRVPANGHFPASSQQEVALGGAAFFDSGTAVLLDDTVVDGTEGINQQDLDEEEIVLQDQPVHTPEQSPETMVENDPVKEEVSTPVGTPVESPLDDAAETELVVVSAEIAQADGFSMDPYLLPVGSEGWSLHVYSFPDSVRAEKEKGILTAKGFHCETRTVEIKDKGRWFRIYLGSFKTKAEARVARLELMGELGEDWANPVRF